MLYDWNSDAVSIPVNTAVPFNQADSIVGDAIMAISNDAFVINYSGAYRAEFALKPGSASNVSGFRFHINGVPVGPLFGPVLTNGEWLTGDFIFEAFAGDVLTLVLLGGSPASGSLASGANATITISQISAAP